MTPDQYVESILAKYAVPRGPTSPAEQVGSAVAGPLRTWAGQQLNALENSGSYAKETGVHGISDVDVFISLKSDTTNTLKEIYDSLYSLAQKQGWSPRQQSVSVGVTVNGTRGDLGECEDRPNVCRGREPLAAVDGVLQSEIATPHGTGCPTRRCSRRYRRS